MEETSGTNKIRILIPQNTTINNSNSCLVDNDRPIQNIIEELTQKCEAKNKNGLYDKENKIWLSSERTINSYSSVKDNSLQLRPLSSTVTIQYEDGTKFEITHSSDSTISSLIGVALETYSTKKNQQITIENWNYGIFCRKKCIWLLEDELFGNYLFNHLENLELLPKPKLIHIVLPNTIKCCVLKYTKDTTVKDILNNIHKKVPDFGISYSNKSVFDLFFLNSENNKKIIHEAQQTYENSNQISCCTQERQESIEKESKQEINMLDQHIEFFDITACDGKFIYSHSLRHKVKHIHPLQLINKGLDVNGGIFLEHNLTVNFYNITENDIILLAVNPDFPDGRTIKNFIPVQNTESQTTKRKKYEFDTTVGEYVKQLCKSYQMNPHTKDYSLYVHPYGGQEGYWLEPTSTVLSCSLFNEVYIEFKRRNYVSNSNTLLQESRTIQIHSALQLQSTTFTINNSVHDNLIKFVPDKVNFPITLKYNPDTLILQIKKQIFFAVTEIRENFSIQDLVVQLVQDDHTDPILLREERSLLSYCPSRTGKLILSQATKKAPVDSILIDTSRMIVKEQEVTPQRNNPFDQKSKNLKKVNTFPKKNFVSQQKTVGEISEMWSKSSCPANEKECNTALYLFSNNEAPHLKLPLDDTRISEYHCQAPLVLSNKNLSSKIKERQHSIKIALDFLEDDPIFSREYLQEHLHLNSPFEIEIQFSRSTTVEQIIEEIKQKLIPPTDSPSEKQENHKEADSTAETNEESTSQPQNKINSTEFALCRKMEVTGGLFYFPRQRALQSFGIQSNSSPIYLKRAPIEVTVTLYTTKLQSKTPTSKANDRLNDKLHLQKQFTYEIANPLSTPVELLENLFNKEKETVDEKLIEYYGIFNVHKNQWLANSKSLLSNQVQSGDIFDVKIKSEKIQVNYFDLCILSTQSLLNRYSLPVHASSNFDKLSNGNSESVILEIEVDYTQPLFDIIYSQLLGKVNLNKRDLIEVRIVNSNLHDDFSDESGQIENHESFLTQFLPVPKSPPPPPPVASVSEEISLLDLDEKEKIEGTLSCSPASPTLSPSPDSSDHQSNPSSMERVTSFLSQSPGTFHSSLGDFSSNLSSSPVSPSTSPAFGTSPHSLQLSSSPLQSNTLNISTDNLASSEQDPEEEPVSPSKPEREESNPSIASNSPRSPTQPMEDFLSKLSPAVNTQIPITMKSFSEPITLNDLDAKAMSSQLHVQFVAGRKSSQEHPDVPRTRKQTMKKLAASMQIKELDQKRQVNIQRMGKLLNTEQSLASQGIIPGDYCIYVYRLQIGGSPNADQDEQDDDVNIWEPASENDLRFRMVNNKTVVQGGTLNKLIEHLTAETQVDIRFMQTFLLTYQSFTTPEKLLRKLIQRYQVPKPIDIDEAAFKTSKQTPIRIRVSNCIKNWLESYSDDLTDDFFNELQDFIENFIDRDELTHLSAILRSAIKKARDVSESKLKIAHKTAAPPAILPRDIASAKFMDFDDEEIARQLCIIDSNLFYRIKSTEFLNQAWSKPKFHYRCQNLLNAIDRFNEESEWVSTMILNVPSTKARGKIMAKFINIAKYLKIYGNYNSVMAFIGGLNIAAVSRLKWTKKEVSKKSMETLMELERFMSNEFSFKNYRAQLQLHLTEQPCIPYLGVHLSDLTFIEEGNPHYLEGTKLINFERRQLIYDVVHLIQCLQRNYYNFQEVNQLSVLLTKLPRMSDKHLYQLSLKHEPRGGIPPDIERKMGGVKDGFKKKTGGLANEVRKLAKEAEFPL